MTTDASADASASPLFIIRLALAAGIVMFGAVIVFVHANGVEFGIDEAVLRGLRYGGTGTIAATFLGVLGVRSWRQNASSFADARSRTIIGWAVGDGAAMLGGIVYLLSGDPLLFALGCVVFGVALVGISPPDPTEAPEEIS